jgi:Tfp pilus assembly protein PilN
MRPVNLLPQDARRQSTSERPGAAYGVLGVLALLLVMTVAYVLTSNSLNQRTSDASAASAKADQLEAQVKQLGSFTNFAQVRQTRLASVAGVAEGRFDWERLMRELARIMPSGSWLQTTDASTTPKEDVASAPPGTTTNAGPVGPNATFVGCTPKQGDVARMMVRMKRMHRVSDVKLNESSREAISATAAGGGDNGPTVDNCGRFYKFDLTVEFEPSAPVKEAPRGAAKVPASLGGGS